MSKYTTTLTKEYNFEDDTVRVKFRRMKRKHMLKLFPDIQEYTAKQEANEPANEILTRLLNEVLEFADEYVVAVEGLKDSEGNAITKEIMFEETYFLELTTLISTDLLEASLGPLAEK